jgi:hypothetical protein
LGDLWNCAGPAPAPVAWFQDGLSSPPGLGHFLWAASLFLKRACIGAWKHGPATLGWKRRARATGPHRTTYTARQPDKTKLSFWKSFLRHLSFNGYWLAPRRLVTLGGVVGQPRGVVYCGAGRFDAAMPRDPVRPREIHQGTHGRPPDGSGIFRALSERALSDRSRELVRGIERATEIAK